MTSPLTAEIARFAAGLTFGAVPTEAVRRVAAAFADCVGVMLAGHDLPVTAIARRFAKGGTRSGPFLGGLGLPPAPTGLVYGTAAHALDYDDTGLNGHPSAVLVPAILAASEGTKADGRKMITAYLAGFEAWAELSWRETDPYHEKGWHPSPVFGVVATAAAIANLRGLDAETTARAIAIAASSAAGICANFGSMTKPFQLGRSVQFGIEAVELASLGLTAGAEAIEAELGFLRAFSPAERVDRTSAVRLGTHWEFLASGINIKLYPMCYAAHRSIDATLEMMKTHALSAADIVSMEVEIGPTQSAVLQHHDPRTPLQAKFSAEFAVAAAARYGGITQSELEDSAIIDPELRRLIAATRVIVVQERDPEYPVFSPTDVVRAVLRDGRSVSSRPVHRPRGHHTMFPGSEELWAKFADCARDALPEAEARALFDRLLDLEAMASTDAIYGNDSAARRDPTLPLAGVRVVELGTSVAGPSAGMILAELGAHVIKVEGPNGDDARHWGPPFLGNAAAMFQAINRNKRSVAVDFKDPAQLERLKDTVLKGADIVLQNLRPGVVEKFGLDAETLRAADPELIYCNMSAFGRTGPLASMPGYDPLLQAFGGIMSVTGHEDAEPVRVGPSVLDQGSGMWAVIGILAALLDRRAGQGGRRVDTSLFETALSWLCMHFAQLAASGRAPRKMGSENGGMVPYKAYRASDGWLVIAAANDGLFRRFAHAIGHPEWLEQSQFADNPSRVKNRDRLNDLIAEAVAGKPRQHWIDALGAVQVPCAAIQSLDEVLAHPQTAATGMYQTSFDGSMQLMGLPLSFDGVRPAFRSPPPALDDHGPLMADPIRTQDAS